MRSKMRSRRVWEKNAFRRKRMNVSKTAFYFARIAHAMFGLECQILVGLSEGVNIRNFLGEAFPQPLLNI